MKKTMIALLLCLACVFAFTLAYAGDDLAQGKTVTKVEVGSMPVKTAYVIGEEFTLEGGTLIVTYDDGTTDEIPMTAPSLSIKEPGMKASGTKTVTIKAGKKSARFTVNVANNSYKVNYELNYDGAPAAEVVEMVKGETAEEKQPLRDGHTFCGWYVDPDFTKPYNFKNEIIEDISLYALWTRDGAEHANVTFNYGYYGLALAEYAYPVEIGTAVAKPQVDPVRVGYTFTGWKDANGADYDFAAAITGELVLTAGWEKAVSGVQTWVFEAEDTNLSGKTGPAISGTANEIGMIMLRDKHNCSNERCVGYLYQFGNSLEFYFSSDTEVEDAIISLSLSAEMDDLTIDPSTYGVYLNGEPLSYETIVIDEVPAFDVVTYVADCPPFEYFLIASQAKLKAGANVVKLVTENSESYTGTTMVAHAPLVDALKIETEAVLIWDENFGVPAVDNYK